MAHNHEVAGSSPAPATKSTLTSVFAEVFYLLRFTAMLSLINTVDPMKKNQNGFAVLEALLVAIIIGILGFTGWFVLNAKKNTEASLSGNNSTTPFIKKKSTAKQSTTQLKFDTSIHEVDIKMQSATDISKLPDYAPVSFKEYMLDLLQKNTPSQYGCIEVYSITKISTVNISGGGSSVNAPNASKDADCISGAPIIWVLTPSNSWDQETLNGYPCKSKGGGLIYEEFVAKCYNNSNDSYYANPNGSVASIKN
jgi:competence protein ComGC